LDYTVYAERPLRKERAMLVHISRPVAAGCIGIAQSNGYGWAVVSDLQHGR
jgi:hypothetical protein